ncbi:hypothetical protein CONLIGDRAFT_687152 [Coniochaeta ligniaria NRRL 30616]|uniref:C2H2-type domain-containing protein n=1 Tax=Coniochaeta ligniaria NRRL 30616 TaxID=1408157 RepID=A0A1J7I5K6_9PEZI|nr:hypothetical protein CONLIGDRAFT_687152 [Coniochaeta ligniaria NRRL 30616]
MSFAPQCPSQAFSTDESAQLTFQSVPRIQMPDTSSAGPGNQTDVVMSGQTPGASARGMNGDTLHQTPAHVVPAALPDQIQLDIDGQKAPETDILCPKCNIKYQSKGSLKLHNDTVHLGKERMACDYPGCPRDGELFTRDSSYRRHMKNIHGIEVATKNKVRKTAITAAEQGIDEQDQEMQNFLQGEGNRLPVDQQMCTRQEIQAQHDMPDDINSLKSDNANLREQVRKLQAELRIYQAASDSEMQHLQKLHRNELDEVHNAHQEELEALRSHVEDSRPSGSTTATR